MKVERPSRQVLVLGAGLAGLAAGYELVKGGFEVTIVEKNEAVGGLARTIEKNGFRFDTGPHRWYTKNDMVNNWMLKLLGKEVIKVPRLTRIYFDRKFFNYPIKIKSTILGMGLVKTILAVLDYGLVRIQAFFHSRPPVTLEEGYVSKFGRTLYEMFFRRYSEKLWGTSCKNISADWIGQRTRGFNITTIIKDVLFKKQKTVSFVDEFVYPAKGIGHAGGTKGSGDFLFHFRHAHITFDKIVIKRDIKVIHEGQNLFLVSIQPLNQAARFAFARTTPFSSKKGVRRIMPRISPIPPGEDGLIAMTPIGDLPIA